MFELAWTLCALPRTVDAAIPPRFWRAPGADARIRNTVERNRRVQEAFAVKF
jgi:hypothetical protein